MTWGANLIDDHGWIVWLATRRRLYILLGFRLFWFKQHGRLAALTDIPPKAAA